MLIIVSFKVISFLKKNYNKILTLANTGVLETYHETYLGKNKSHFKVGELITETLNKNNSLRLTEML